MPLDLPTFILLGFLMIGVSALFYLLMYNKGAVYRRNGVQFHPVNGVGMRALYRPVREMDADDPAGERRNVN